MYFLSNGVYCSDGEKEKRYEDGAGLVDVLDEGDETELVPGPGVLHHKLLISVKSEQRRGQSVSRDEVQYYLRYLTYLKIFFFSQFNNVTP